MDVREKLFTLFQDCNNPSWKWFPNNAEMMKLIDYLIDHGVTVQEWVSVEDRLPERTLPPKDVLVYHDLGCGMFVDRAWYSYDKKRWCSVLGMKLKVTHWMPLPHPPKGE